LCFFLKISLCHLETIKLVSGHFIFFAMNFDTFYIMITSDKNWKNLSAYNEQVRWKGIPLTTSSLKREPVWHISIYYNTRLHICIEQLKTCSNWRTKIENSKTLNIQSHDTGSTAAAKSMRSHNPWISFHSLK
jgi:hypothetical protein